MNDPTAPTGFDDIQQRALSRLFGILVTARLAGAPVLGSVAVWVALVDRAPWRRVVVISLVASLLAVSAWEWARFRSRGLRPGAFAFNVAVNVAALLVVTVATGGVESPVLPATPMLALMTGVVTGGGPAGAAVLGAQLAALATLATAQATGAVPPLLPDVLAAGAPGPHNAALLATRGVIATVMSTAGYQIGRELRARVDGMLRETLAARDEALRAHVEQARTLTTLTAEIAHELKNPLASVKGLAVLVGRGLEGRAAEQVGVLRREADRMQGILEEFLNFSRPLVPLAQGSVDLLEVCAEVAALHEGLALERGASVTVRAGTAAVARCDRRKVKQVILNLVQNALDAGGAVELDAARDGDVVRVTVTDEGPGLPEGLGERVFEAGVTTKAQGSGLGLPVARMLARQHGGELTLREREGGGCVATLTLPVAGGGGEGRG